MKDILNIWTDVTDIRREREIKMLMVDNGVHQLILILAGTRWPGERGRGRDHRKADYRPAVGGGDCLFSWSVVVRNAACDWDERWRKMPMRTLFFLSHVESSDDGWCSPPTVIWLVAKRTGRQARCDGRWGRKGAGALGAETLPLPLHRWRGRCICQLPVGRHCHCFRYGEEDSRR